ncbi:MAG: ferrous iron transport protein B [Geminocystis sp.]|nr:ferrous iron transport protein B [Geminocystis sp.]
MKTCHFPVTKLSPNPKKRIALLGQPNTGKSTFFNRLTNSNTYVGNWPGITVDILQGEVTLNGEKVEVVDLPGIYDLNGFSEDERVVKRFLSQFPLDLLVIILNASQMERMVRMALEIKALGLPAVVILNMADEARRYGITIKLERLEQLLEYPVYLISAKYGRGFNQAVEGIAECLAQQKESFLVGDIDAFFEENPLLEEKVQTLLRETVIMPSEEIKTLTDVLDGIFLHPLLGIPLFFLSMLAIFFLIWQVGLPSQDVMDAITTTISAHIIQPILSPLPAIVKSFFLDGIWLGVATVASFVPLIVIFFFLLAAIEDSGYLARIAYLMDAFMAQLGLDGRAFVLQMMGFGCNVPALMGTRIIRSQPMRWLSMLIIPFSLCSARLAVFVFIIAAIFPPSLGPIVLFSLYLLSFIASFLVAFILSKIPEFKSKEPFVIELPPYRLPTFKYVFLRGWGEVKEFLRRATSFIIVGCVAIWFLTSFPVGATGLDTWGGKIGILLQPIMQPIGLDPYLTLSLIFGFIAKEVVVGAFATIYGLNGAALTQQIAFSITPAQAIGFCVFCLLYTPCLSTTATIKSESKSNLFTFLSLLFSLIYAWFMAFIFYHISLLFLH